ncbi:MAG: hypothetical protein ABJC39_12405, partial [Chloroflexota bacterium]
MVDAEVIDGSGHDADQRRDHERLEPELQSSATARTGIGRPGTLAHGKYRRKEPARSSDLPDALQIDPFGCADLKRPPPQRRRQAPAAGPKGPCREAPVRTGRGIEAVTQTLGEKADRHDDQDDRQAGEGDSP